MPVISLKGRDKYHRLKPSPSVCTFLLEHWKLAFCWLCDPHTGRERWSHTWYSVFWLTAFYECAFSLWFSCTTRTLSHVWLDRSVACEEEHLKSLAVRSLGPTELTLYYYWWNSWFKEGRYQWWCYVCLSKAFWVWGVLGSLDLLQSWIRWLDYFCSCLWTVTVVAYT